MSHYILTNWAQHQHYKDRDPPWVKLYRDTLTSESWVLGTDVSRLVQVASIMLAARYSNKIPLNFPMLRKVASFDFNEKAFREALDHLAACNFVEIQEDEEDRKQPDSKPLASCATTSDGLYSEKRESREEQRRKEAFALAREASGLDCEAWDRWLAYRRGIRKPIRDVSAVEAARDMAKLGAGQSAAVAYTIAKGWTGLREPDPGKPSALPPKREREPTADEIAAERAKAAAQNAAGVAKALRLPNLVASR